MRIENWYVSFPEQNREKVFLGTSDLDSLSSLFLKMESQSFVEPSCCKYLYLERVFIGPPR
jgi:hypothetical protein